MTKLLECIKSSTGMAAIKMKYFITNRSWGECSYFLLYAVLPKPLLGRCRSLQRAIQCHDEVGVRLLPIASLMVSIWICSTSVFLCVLLILYYYVSSCCFYCGPLCCPVVPEWHCEYPVSNGFWLGSEPLHLTGSTAQVRTVVAPVNGKRWGPPDSDSE